MEVTKGPGDAIPTDPSHEPVALVHSGGCGGKLVWPCCDARPSDGAPYVCLRCGEIRGYVCTCQGCRGIRAYLEDEETRG